MSSRVSSAQVQHRVIKDDRVSVCCGYDFVSKNVHVFLKNLISLSFQEGSDVDSEKTISQKRVSLFFSIAKNERLHSRKTADPRTKRTNETRLIFCADKDSRLRAFTRDFIAARALENLSHFSASPPSWRDKRGRKTEKKISPPSENGIAKLSLANESKEHLYKTTRRKRTLCKASLLPSAADDADIEDDILIGFSFLKLKW